jgi:Tol biopolymer transport system component
MLHRNPRFRAALCASFLGVVVASGASAQSLVRASVDANGVEGNDASFGSVLSADGRWLAFSTFADNLVAGDVYSHHVLVRDLLNGRNHVVVVGGDGKPAKGSSYGPGISTNGRWVTYSSEIADLVAGDTNGCRDVFLRDREAGSTERVSLAWDGAEANRESWSWSAGSMSDSAGLVVFTSCAQNLVLGKTTPFEDVFVRDRVRESTVRVSVAWDGAEAEFGASFPSLSSDGRFVVFSSGSSNLVPGDTNDKHDLFVRDLHAGTLERANLTHDGFQANESAFSSSLSRDGRIVCFASDATNLVRGDTNGATDIFVRDRLLGTTERCSVSREGVEADWYSDTPALSANGRFVAYLSHASNLVAGDTNGRQDVFLRDCWSGATMRLSSAATGEQGDNHSRAPSISGDGRVVAFESDATNLVSGDSNRYTDVFVADRGRALESTYCTAAPSAHGCLAAISGRGTPSLTSAEPYVIAARDVPGRSTGVLSYGFRPVPALIQVSGVCIAPPIRRLGPMTAGGAAIDCSGSFGVDFNAHLQSGADPALVPGLEVFCQWWYIDSTGPIGSFRSDALLFTLQP